MAFLTFLIETESENIPHASILFGMCAVFAGMIQILLTLHWTGGLRRYRDRASEPDVGKETYSSNLSAGWGDISPRVIRGKTEAGQLVALNLFLALCCGAICIGAWRNRGSEDAVMLKMSVFAVWTVTSVLSFLVAADRIRQWRAQAGNLHEEAETGGHPDQLKEKVFSGGGKSKEKPEGKFTGSAVLSIMGRVLSFVGDNWLVLVMVLLAVAWMIPGMSNALHGDAGLNFRFYHDQRSVFSLTSFRTMDAYTHLGYAYSFGVLMLQGLTGDTQFSMHFWNVVLYVLGCLAFYGIVRDYMAYVWENPIGNESLAVRIAPDDGRDIRHNLREKQKHRRGLYKTEIVRTQWFSCVFPALAAGIFIFSPYTMGMADDATWDYWTIFLFVILLYCHLKKWDILEAAVGFAFCFTKEPCVIVYAVFIFCVFVLDCRENGIRQAVRRWNYWFSLYIGVVWLFLYEVYAHWAYTGGNAFRFDPDYIGERLKTVLFLNFGWVTVTLMVVEIAWLIVCAGKRRWSAFTYRGESALSERSARTIAEERENGPDRENGYAETSDWRSGFPEILLPAGISWLAFLVFSCTFVTVNNPRYIDCGLVFPCLMTALLMAEIGAGGNKKQWPVRGEKKVLSVIMSASLSALMLCSVFRTIDPVSLSLFPQMETGNGVQLLVGSSWNEGATYNAQHLYQEDAFNLALADVFDQNTETVIVFPLTFQNPWYFDGLGLWQNIPEGYCRVTEYWDPDIRKRCVYADTLSEPYASGAVSGTGGGSFEILEAKDIDALKQQLDGADTPQSESEAGSPNPINHSAEDRIYCFFYTDLAGRELADAIRQSYTVVRESDYTAHNWVMHCVMFR